MIRSLKEEDIPLILSWYNWYIEHSEATFETEQLSLEEFRDRVHMIMKTYPWIILEEDGKPVGYAYLASFIPRAIIYACFLSSVNLLSFAKEAIQLLVVQPPYERFTPSTPQSLHIC